MTRKQLRASKRRYTRKYREWWGSSIPRRIFGIKVRLGLVKRVEAKQ
jgi:hypothetical protein